MMTDSVPDSASHIVADVANVIVADSLSVEEKVGFFTAKIPAVIDWAIHAGLKLLLAIVILSVGFWIAKKLSNWFVKILKRREVEPSLRTFLRSICSIILKVIVIIIAAQVVGIETMSFAAVIAALGVGIGMALSGTLQNFAGGVVLLLFKPFKTDDFIESQDFSGTVMEIQIFMTVLKTPDNKTLYIPNSSLISAPIINYTKNDIRRLDMEFSVAYGTDIAKARKIINDVVTNDKRTLKDPQVNIVITSLADSAVIISTRAWTATSDYWDLKFHLTETVYNAFNANGIEIPFPQIQIHTNKN